ncbi:MAG: hypothetical protein HC921_03445 [Synechococcaceae cyanobacterium SM2_3_1]|nr:hypothetical protein [Synechococcaceae cyanobacterium SM2_3_1]
MQKLLPQGQIQLPRLTDSLQVRLIFTSMLTAILALAGAGGMVTWRLHRELITKAKLDHEHSVELFHQDVAKYQEGTSPQQALSLVVEKYSSPNRSIQVTDPSGELLVKDSQLAMNLLLNEPAPLEPRIIHVDDHTLVRCSQPITLQDRSQVRVETITDVTRPTQIYRNFVRTITLSGAGMVLLISTLGIWAIRRSLSPLGNMCVLSDTISADTLSQARLVLENPPEEVSDLAAAFNGMLNRLSRSWAHEQELLSTISYELRTPLAMVQNHIESLLRRSDNLTEIQIENLKISLEETQRITRLLKELLDLTRLETGVLHLHMEVLSLNSFVESMGSIASLLGPNPIKVEVPKEQLPAMVDRDRLKQVLLNLLTNAIRYSPPTAPIVLRLTRSVDTAVLQVQDQGIGIPEDKLEQIFVRFYSVSEARSRQHGGFGLGLAITKALVESMRGRITVESEVNVGSTFSIILPIR